MTIVKSKFETRTAFTLVELLIVIAIMGVLAGMTLGLMRSAQDDAKEAATLSRITRIEALLLSEMENYEVRRLPTRALVAGDRVEVRNMKRRVLADIINAEMPRPELLAGAFVRSDDLGEFPTRRVTADAPSTPADYDQGFTQFLTAKYAATLTELQKPKFKPAGVRHWERLKAKDTAVPSEFNLPSEYLYEILSRIDYDGVSGVEALGGAAIGETDDDDYLEVVDGWGEPLLFRIVQVSAIARTVGTKTVWEDDPADLTNWNNKVPTNWDIDPPDDTNPATNRELDMMPQGYELLNPAIPRSISQIRFQVYSERLKTN